MKKTAVIVDDEQPICEEIEYLLGQHIDIEVKAKFTNGMEALDYIFEKQPDIVFLDIKMPGMSGLELAKRLQVLQRPPFIIFITAFAEHAVEAFDTPAIGYVTKPVMEERLAKALNKVRNLTALNSVTKNVLANKICVRCNGKIIPLDKQEIIFVFAKDKDVFVRTKTNEFLSLLTMQEFEQSLSESNFLRVHRQFIINLDQICEIVPWFHGSYLLRMNECKNQDIPVSRNKVKLLKAFMGLK
ncbi:MAG TPA: LytTR family DNA-binding domain-containing protein [Negativicutes bacterium]|jgi:DNA-binding LytR/AlgR family response regulator